MTSIDVEVSHTLSTTAGLLAKRNNVNHVLLSPI